MELVYGLFVTLSAMVVMGVGLGLAAKIAVYIIEFKWGNDE